MLRFIVFQESSSFFENLDSAIGSGIPIKIVFSIKLADQDSALWGRLGRCKGWSTLIPFDFLMSRPEFMPPAGFANAVNELVPLFSNAIHFRRYGAYRIYTQQTHVGIKRRILLRPLHHASHA